MRVACSTVQLFHCNVAIYEHDRRAMARERTQHVAAVEELAGMAIRTYIQTGITLTLKSSGYHDPTLSSKLAFLFFHSKKGSNC